MSNTITLLVLREYHKYSLMLQTLYHMQKDVDPTPKQFMTKMYETYNFNQA